MIFKRVVFVTHLLKSMLNLLCLHSTSCFVSPDFFFRLLKFDNTLNNIIIIVPIKSSLIISWWTYLTKILIHVLWLIPICHKVPSKPILYSQVSCILDSIQKQFLPCSIKLFCTVLLKNIFYHHSYIVQLCFSFFQTLLTTFHQHLGYLHLII